MGMCVCVHVRVRVCVWVFANDLSTLLDWCLFDMFDYFVAPKYSHEFMPNILLIAAFDVIWFERSKKKEKNPKYKFKLKPRLWHHLTSLWPCLSPLSLPLPFSLCLSLRYNRINFWVIMNVSVLLIMPSAVGYLWFEADAWCMLPRAQISSGPGLGSGWAAARQ